MSPFIRTHPLRSSLLQKLAALTLLASAPSIASAQTPVVYGDTISEPGLYFLAGNQTGSGSDGIAIGSDDVVLVLGRFTLRGDGMSVGIQCHAYNRVTIVGGRVTQFALGMSISEGEDCTVEGTRFDHNVYDGMIAREMRDSKFLRLQCDYNGDDGVDARQCAGSRFVSIRSHHNGEHGFFVAQGLKLAGVPGDGGVTIRLCWAAYNKLDGIRIQDSNLHVLLKNQCVNNDQAGIRLFTGLPDPKLEATQSLAGPQDNVVRSNWCVFNQAGIVVDRYASDNTLENNTALANFHRDVIDDTDAPPCENTWFLNFFLTKGGAGAGCIF